MSSTFSSNREKYLGFAESAAGVGLMIGPILGGAMNTYIGYLPCYLIFAGILMGVFTTNLIFLPSSLNSRPVIS